MVIDHIRRRGMIAGMITNGYLLTAERIQRLNRAGLDHLQISIDNVKPDQVSKKSLKVLDRKLQPLRDQEREVYMAMRSMEKTSYARINYFQDNIAHGKENNWRCRAGSRYLYVCEEGLVHYCSQQRGYPGKPLAEYT